MRIVINILLTLVIITLGYLLYESVMEPIRFNQEKDKREAAIIERLIDIRSAQVLYRGKYGSYTGSFDTLIDFIKYDSIPIVFRRGQLTDEQLERGMTEAEGIRRGFIVRDTAFTTITDSIFKTSYPIDSMRYVPYAGGAEFNLEAGVVETASRVSVRVFEASVLNDVFLRDLDRQQVINYNELRSEIVGFPGLRVGNINTPNNNAGNWEN